MFTIDSSLFNKISSILIPKAQLASIGPNVTYICHGCTSMCQTSCASSCKGGCHRSCSGERR